MFCRDKGVLYIDLHIDFQCCADSHTLICPLNLRLYITASENLPYSWGGTEALESCNAIILRQDDSVVRLSPKKIIF